MRLSAFPSLSALLLAAGALCVAPAPSHAFLGLFGKKDKGAPAADERQAQEAAASALLAEGQQAQRDGKTGKARDAYSRIQREYPFTNAAAEAAYAAAVIARSTSDVSTAFDAFQKFIDDHRASPRFNDAIQQQFELAEEARSGRRHRALLVIPVRMGGEDLVGLYQKIIKNAPFGKLAPVAQFTIGEVYQDLGEKEKSVAAFQTVVDNYPSTQQAREAQFRIGSISSVAASRSEDKSNLIATRDALTSYMTANPSGERADEAELILNQVNAAEATQSLEIGKFYERMGKTKAAAIYYNEALKYGSPEASKEARTHLADLAAKDPEAVAAAQKGQPDQDYTVPGAKNLKRSQEYVGPLAPESARPKMRAGDDSFLPIPLQEPVLPLSPGVTPPAAGSLLPPAAGSPLPPVPEPLPVPEKPAVPASPGIPLQKPDNLPVPPKPPAP